MAEKTIKSTNIVFTLPWWASFNYFQSCYDVMLLNAKRDPKFYFSVAIWRNSRRLKVATQYLELSTKNNFIKPLTTIMLKTVVSQYFFVYPWILSQKCFTNQCLFKHWLKHKCLFYSVFPVLLSLRMVDNLIYNCVFLAV